jgi:hypothetical protein
MPTIFVTANDSDDGSLCLTAFNRIRTKVQENGRTRRARDGGDGLYPIKRDHPIAERGTARPFTRIKVDDGLAPSCAGVCF